MRIHVPQVEEAIPVRSKTAAGSCLRAAKPIVLNSGGEVFRVDIDDAGEFDCRVSSAPEHDERDRHYVAIAAAVAWIEERIIESRV